MIRNVRTAILLVGVAWAAPAVAQTGLALTPTIGIYAPATNLVNASIGGEQVRLKQDVSAALGGRLSMVFGERITVSAAASYASSNLESSIDGVAATQGKTNLWIGSGRATFWLSSPRAPVSFGLGAGIGFVNRSDTRVMTPGNNLLTSPGGTDVSALFTGVMGIRLGRLGLFVAVDNYIYQPDVLSSYGIANPTQNDIIFNLGLGIPLGR